MLLLDRLFPSNNSGSRAGVVIVGHSITSIRRDHIRLPPMDGATSETTPASSSNGLKKVFTRPNRSKTTLSEVDGSTSSRSAAPSIDSNHETRRPSTSGGGGGGGAAAGSYDGPPTGISKLIPGARRRRKKKMETENSISQDNGSGTELHRISNEPEDAPSLPTNVNRSSSTVDTSNGSESGRWVSSPQGILFTVDISVVSRNFCDSLTSR